MVYQMKKMGLWPNTPAGKQFQLLRVQSWANYLSLQLLFPYLLNEDKNNLNHRLLILNNKAHVMGSVFNIIWHMIDGGKNSISTIPFPFNINLSVRYWAETI